jgi:bZIP factor
MAMDIANGEHNILDWDEDQVHRWLSSLGFSQYEAQIKGAVRFMYI